MFRYINITSLFAVLFFAATVLSVESDGAKPCFLVGNLPLPSDVKPDPNVRCIPDSKAFDSLNALPDVEFGKDAFLIRFTAISFLTDTRVSSVRFAINHFPITQDREYLVNAMTLYGAINAGLRSLGDRPSGIFLGPLKGVEFFLEFQVNCKDKDILGRKGAQRNYFKTLKNCYKCTDDDKKALRNLGLECKVPGI